MEHKEIAIRDSIVTHTCHALLNARKMNLTVFRGMVQEIAKEIVRLIKYATQVDAQKTVQKIHLEVCQEMEMEPKETASLTRSVTKTWNALPNAQRMQLMVLLVMVPEPAKEIAHPGKFVFSEENA